MKRLSHKLLSCFNFNIPRKYDDAVLSIPFVNGLKVGISGEPWMLEILKKLFILREGVFIDVGVNLGQTLIKVKSADPLRRYIGFEPNPVCITYVNKLIEANTFEKCTLIPAGLFTETKILQLNLYQDNEDDSSASIIKELRPVEEIKQSIYIPVSEFDAASKLLNIDTVGLIKVDVEGAELEVFKTLTNTISSDRPFILVEILPVTEGRDNEGISRQKQIEKLFRHLNYQFYRINKTRDSKFSGLEKVNLTNLNQNTHLRDYLLLPKELSKMVERKISS